MEFSLAEVAAALGAAHRGADSEVTGWSVDTRTLAAGDLFIALRGPNHDGHAFVEAAFGRGAAGALVEAGVVAMRDGWKLIEVGDTQQALEQLGSWARGRWNGDVVAVTGTAGKTTTKEAIAAMLAVEMAVGKTAGNLNNHIGVPLSLLRLPAGSKAAVIEMGMNHAGEIRHLASIAQPRIGVVTNVGYGHVEAFPDGIEGVAAAKRELIEALPEDGVAVLNADDTRVSKFATAARCRVLTFGLETDADVRAEEVEYSAEGVRFRVRGVEMRSPLSGRHGILNLLAGIAVASIYGIEPGRLAGTVRTIEPGAMRGRRIEHNGALLIDDCYNSNPASARAMVDLVRDLPARRRVVVLGEMLELGRWSGSLHAELGSYVARSGCDVLVGIRGEARRAVEAAREEGMPSGAAYFFDDPVEAGAALRDIVREGDVVLWKGSRGTQVERALERFLA